MNAKPAISVAILDNGGGRAPWTIDVTGAPHPLGANRGDAIWREDVLRATLKKVMRKLGPSAVLHADDQGWMAAE
jgi:hypothetical protein